jgi:hypothetical protein
VKVAIREIRLAIAELLIAKVLRVLPDGPERIEFAEFITTSWISRVARQGGAEMNRPDVLLGDVGFVRGRTGVFYVTSGAPLPSNVVACSPSARDACEPSEALGLNDGSFVSRADFVRWDAATPEQRRTNKME